jgi:FtsP/CotA-like multicopper oxidase with cupredoxin domain
MNRSRRTWLQGGTAAGAALLLAQRPAQASQAPARWAENYSGANVQATEPGLPGEHYDPVLTPNGSTLPFRIVDGVKVFHLVAEEVEHEFAPGLTAQCWGYNGQVHGPTIEAVEGDHVRIYVTNRLPEPTTVHWHGVFLPCGMDGVGGLTQPVIQPGETWVYEWVFRQHGTLSYHAHHDEMTQMAMGLMGMIVVHPRNRRPEDRVDRDYALMMSEWRIRPGTRRPDPNAMSDFNVLTFNARCFPGTAPLVAQSGDRVRIRFANLSAMDHHPIHLHGHWFRQTETDGGPIPLSAQHPDSTLPVPAGTTRTIEFIADNPGDWAMHCHMTHHVMNQMGHDIPNMLGVDPAAVQAALKPSGVSLPVLGHNGMDVHGLHVETGHMKVPENSIPMVGQRGPYDYITMGGMFTILKVREHLENDADPGWYAMPEGTQSRAAENSELKRDGIV